MACIRPHLWEGLPNSRKRHIPGSRIVAMIVLVSTMALSPLDKTILACDDVTSIDFKNLTIHFGRRVFPFKNGIALNWDSPGGSIAADWKAEIERDEVVKPAPGVSVRFLLIHDSHETGSGWRYYILGYRCYNGRMEEVLRRDGLSLKVDRLDASGITVSLTTIQANRKRKHWSYRWDEQRSIYVLSSTWSTL